MYFRSGNAGGRCLPTKWILISALLAAVGAGCAAFRVPEEPPEPAPMLPVWNDDILEDHLEFLNKNEAAERTTGTQGYARAAEYVAARMREFRLQPAIEGDFRVVYSTAINFPISAALRSVAGRDSLVFYPGIDFLPDGRSDSGFVSVRTIVITDDTTGISSAPSAPFGVVFREGDVAMTTLERWRAQGAVLAVTVDPLEPRYYNRRIPGLIVVQLSPRALRRLLTPDVAVAPYGEAVRLDRVIVAGIRADFRSGAGAINIMGYVAGKHPVRARDLVLVCADLDAVGDFAGVQTLDFRNFAVGTGALLEVARNLSFVSRRWSLPERSVMLAVWSGARLGHAGLQYFLRDPTWPLRRIRSVIYIGLDADEVPAVREMLAEHGLTLHVIPAPKVPLHDRPLVLLPDPTLRRLARESRRSTAADSEEAPATPVVPDLDVVIDFAVLQAKALADAAYDLMMLVTTDDRPFYPAREDTLKIPSSAEDSSP